MITHRDMPSPVVVVVEDDPVQVEIFSALILELGFIPMVATGHLQASRMIRRYSRIIDFVICDNRIGADRVGQAVRALTDALGIGCAIVSASQDAEVDCVKPIGPAVLRDLIQGRAAA
ncbi:MAG: hypothetical protein JST04_10005 [Bdellovibrionales bacterium]|nr:hypothetical protein [Bdellovibrionales bacterium]